MALIDISIGDLVFYKSSEGDESADAGGTEPADAEQVDGGAIDSETDAATEQSDAVGGPATTDTVTRRLPRGRTLLKGGAVLFGFAVALAGLLAVAVVAALAIALKIRRALSAGAL